MKSFKFVFIVIITLSVTSSALAQQSSWSSVIKSTAQSAVSQVATQQLSPDAQKAVDEAKKISVPAQQESFLITKAKEFLAAGHYQTALDLASYVKTILDAKSIDAKKIIADAQAALAKIVQQK